MKLCIAGKNNISVDCLYYSLTLLPKEEICVVLNKTDNLKNNWQKSLGFYAKKENIKIKTLEEVQKIKDIVFLSLEYDRLIKPELFQSARLYNIHFSLLPEYKGMYTSLWPILHNKDYSGVTLHEIDKGIDTGNIIEQIKFSILGFTSYELYRTYLKFGTKLVCKNFMKLINNEYNSNDQSILNSTYFSKSSFNFNEIEIYPKQTAYQIQQFVRALNFRVYQLPRFENNKIYKTQITNTKSNKKPGTIIFEDIEKIEISSIDYNIILFKDYYLELVDCCKYNNLEYAKRIIDYIPNIDEIEVNGWSPLIIACYHGSYDVVNLLLERGANVNSQNLNGTTALMYAKEAYLKSKDFSIIKNLIQFGANINMMDNSGKTIFDYCKDKNLIDFLKKNLI